MLSRAKLLLVAVLLAAIFNDGLALNCSSCTTLVSWEACDKYSDYWTCSDEIVLYDHGFFGELNPTLPLNKTSAFTQGYKCYNLELLFGVEKQNHGYARGCTFAEVDFCKGWIAGAEVVNCSTCRSEDPNSCNGAFSAPFAVGLWMNLAGIVVLMVR